MKRHKRKVSGKQMRLSSVATLLVAGVAMSGAAWFAVERARDWRQLAMGQRIYSERCATCHGPNLEGEANWRRPLRDGRMPAPPHNGDGHTWHHGDAELVLITKEGMAAVVPNYESNMPAFKGALTDAEIAAVLSFIKSKWPRRERQHQEARSHLPDG